MDVEARRALLAPSLSFPPTRGLSLVSVSRFRSASAVARPSAGRFLLALLAPPIAYARVNLSRMAVIGRIRRC